MKIFDYHDHLLSRALSDFYSHRAARPRSRRWYVGVHPLGWNNTMVPYLEKCLVSQPPTTIVYALCAGGPDISYSI